MTKSRLFLLAGILCLFFAIFLFFQQQSSPTSNNQPLDHLTNENSEISQLPGVTSATVTSDCDVQILTNNNQFTVPTQFDPSLSKCDDYVVIATSPSRQFVAFEDLSQKGVDAQLNLFDNKWQRTYLIDDLETFSILDLLFLPDDRLVILFSQGLNGKQFLRLYDTKAISQDIQSLDSALESAIINAQEISADHTLEKGLTNLQRTAFHLGNSESHLLVLDEDRNFESPLLKIDLENL